MSTLAQSLVIDRTNPFNPVAFMGPGWSFWRGPANGNGLEGEFEEDITARTLNELDPSKILLEAHLKGRETYTTGNERISRLITAKRIRLDLDLFQMFWNDQSLIPPLFKKKRDGNTTLYIFFDGQVLRGPLGGRYALCFYWGGGEWRWDYDGLDDGRDVHDPSAVLAS